MSKKTVECVATGYLWAMRDMGADISGVDTWMEVDAYDINLCGSYFSEDAPKDGLAAYVYPSGWEHNLPDCLFFVTATLNQGESK
jgi:hypothetical protein